MAGTPTNGPMCRALREAQGLKRIQLATRCGISYPHLHNIEHGRKRPSVEVLNRIANELGVNVNTLIDHSASATNTEVGDRAA